MGSIFGKLFTAATFGESHGAAVGVVVDGCPSGLELGVEDIQHALERRRPGQSAITTTRDETDKAEILSGLYQGKTLGTPIAILVRNKDARPGAYDEIAKTYRPSHADYTYEAKYGLRDPNGGGRASARETVGRVAAGAIAQKLLVAQGIEIRAYVERVHDISLPTDYDAFPSISQVDQTPVRCPDEDTAKRMIERIEQIRSEGDSVGGVIVLRARGVPAGLGEPVFDRLNADLAKAIFSIPAVKGVEVGSGFSASLMKGSEHNDAFYCEKKKVRTLTNHSGGIQGGISNGEEIVLRCAFKPTATIFQPQQTVTADCQPMTLVSKGRHDPCVVPRAVPIVEAMAALVLADHWMRQKAQRESFCK